jgi:hypothetical protein
MTHLSLAVAEAVAAPRTGDVKDGIWIGWAAPAQEKVAADDQDGRRESRQRQGQGSEHRVLVFSPLCGPPASKKTSQRGQKSISQNNGASPGAGDGNDAFVY